MGVRRTTARPTAPRRARPAKRAAISARSVALLLAVFLSAQANAEEIHPQIKLASPPLYEDRQIKVTYEAHNRLIVSPATYKVIEEDIVLAEAHCPGEILIEKRTLPSWISKEDPDGPLQVIPTRFKRIDQKDGSRFFAVDTPSSFKRLGRLGHYRRATIRVRQKASEMRCTDKELIPVETRTLKRRIVDQASYVRSERVPSKITTITERVLVKPAQVTIRKEPCDGE